MRFPLPEHQNQINKYVYRQGHGAVQKLTHTGVDIDTVHFRRVASSMSLGSCFLNIISVPWSECAGQLGAGGVASVQLEVASSISTGSTINHRFLCGYVCVSLCQSIKIEPANILIGLTHRGAHHMLYLWCRRVALSPRAPHTKAHVRDDRDIWLTCWFHLAKEHTVYVFSP